MAISTAAVRTAIAEAGFTRPRGGKMALDIKGFAKASGLKSVHVYKLLSGERSDPQLSTLTRLCQATGKPAAYFDTECVTEAQEEAKEIGDMIGRMDEMIRLSRENTMLRKRLDQDNIYRVDLRSPEVEIIQVIKVRTTGGLGIEGDPVRHIHHYYAMDGQLLAKVDPCRQETTDAR